MPQTLDNLTYTWNNSGVTFTGIKFNVTDTASAAGSLLMDLQVGGVTKFAIKKDGYLNFGGLFGIYWGNTLRVTNAAGTAWAALSSKSLALTQVTASTGAISWSTGFPDGDSGTADLFLYRDGLAGTLAQRNGVNAQTSRLYGTYTDASNYRRLTKTMSAAGVAEIKPEGAGTGASGNVLHISGLPTSNPGPGILWNDAGTVKVGT